MRSDYHNSRPNDERLLIELVAELTAALVMAQFVGVGRLPIISEKKLDNNK
jgi:hypothetical protein